MFYNDNWDKIKERHLAFWQHEMVDRPLVSIYYPKSDVEYQKPEKLEDIWFDSELIMNNKYLMWEKANGNMGDSFRHFFNNLGPGVAAAFLGSSYDFDESTVWFDTNPLIKDWDDISKIKFSEDNWLFNKHIEMTKYYFERRKEKPFILSLTDLGGNLDVAASFTGIQNMLYSFIDEPDEVKKLIKVVDEGYLEVFRRLDKLYKDNQEGFTTWLPVYNDKSWAALQCDISAMMSPKMFEEFAIPSLEYMIREIPNTAYHWDGPDAIPHLDLILGLKDLDVVQWTAGAGQKSVIDPCWFDNYKKILAAGKSLILFLDLYQYSRRGIENFYENIPGKGVFLSIGAPNEEEAGEVMKIVEKVKR